MEHRAGADPVLAVPGHGHGAGHGLLQQADHQRVPHQSAGQRLQLRLQSLWGLRHLLRRWVPCGQVLPPGRRGADCSPYLTPQRVQGGRRRWEGNRRWVEGNRRWVEGNRRRPEGNRRRVEGNRRGVEGNRRRVEGNQRRVEGNPRGLGG